MQKILSDEMLNRMPKVLLHDHLDGSVRASTVVELAKSQNYSALPTMNADELSDWFHRGANKGSLPEYLSGFVHTCAVMQTPEALERAAYEHVEDCQKDGVCYVEVRFAPSLHTANGMHWDEVVNSVLKGFDRGERDFGITARLIICALRHLDSHHSEDMAQLAVDFRDKGVVGFDLAGEEGGYPPKKHLSAFHFCQRANFNLTIHAGEGFGKESIWQAIQWCGAHRIGHATRLIDDMAVHENEVIKMGSLAQYVLDKRIPLEICLSSNIHTGAAASFETHPFKTFYNTKFRVTLNTDNRLMSNTNMTQEYQIARDFYGFTFSDFERISINSMKSAFICYRERCDLIYHVIKPAFAKLRDELAAQEVPR
ncbi:adenosine deaminase [Chloroherpeton thalassium ATCC 35110]|uniref:Adenosine deaminase n=1 Tax=Chloroherpeton thalassium (strain ATCC 35110 / GB-78) TaxID=517418 RepID=B3QU31_CHLT3|nr:adenosine deaminase [Chloroherpeton thalassium]ACF12829.1 adenosine deaminase [Chloroherpeton thalassium ATCC 35110]